MVTSVPFFVIVFTFRLDLSASSRTLTFCRLVVPERGYRLDGASVGAAVGTGVGVAVGTGVGVAVGTGVGVGDGVAMGVWVGVIVGVAVGEGVGVIVGVGIGVDVAVGVGEGIGVIVGVGVGEAVVVAVGVGDSIGDGASVCSGVPIGSWGSFSEVIAVAAVSSADSGIPVGASVCVAADSSVGETVGTAGPFFWPPPNRKTAPAVSVTSSPAITINNLFLFPDFVCWAESARRDPFFTDPVPLAEDPKWNWWEALPEG